MADFNLYDEGSENELIPKPTWLERPVSISSTSNNKLKQDLINSKIAAELNEPNKTLSR